MPAQGRKNVHGKTGVRFNAAYTKSKFDNMIRNVVSELIVHEKVTVTDSCVKPVIAEFSKLISLTKKEDKVAAIREAKRFVRNIFLDEEKKVSATDKLFTELKEKFANRNGGYLATYKVEASRGDNAPRTLITFAK